jgi:hypothetical protein
MNCLEIRDEWTGRGFAVEIEPQASSIGRPTN